MNGNPFADGTCPIDHEHLSDMSAGDTEFEAELMEEFLKVTPGLLSQLGAAIRSEDCAAIEQTAHTLKGSCRSLGARPMSNPCDALETMARSGESVGALELYGEVQRHFSTLSNYIAMTWDVRAA